MPSNDIGECCCTPMEHGNGHRRPCAFGPGAVVAFPLAGSEFAARDRHMAQRRNPGTPAARTGAGRIWLPGAQPIRRL